MCEISISKVDPDMGNARAGRIEEYQISGSQIAFGDGSACSKLGAGLAWNGNPQLLEYILRKSGAIEPVCCGSAGFIGNTNRFMNYVIQR